ncbi:hypothetical protein BC826DRAFT_55939 [Russula brevipes]|nr:hypothetical protein BC826DRAFT_55939 [Russula brevipes]
MNVRKMIESFEQGRSPTVAQPPPLSGPLRTRPRPRQRTQGTNGPLEANSQWSVRTQRPPSPKIVKEDRPVTIVLKDCMNELQIEQKPNVSHLSVPLTSDNGHTLGHPSITSAELLCTLAPPALGSSNTPPILSTSPSAQHSSASVRLALQKRANLRSRRQQRYSREESALATALRRPVEYERIFPSRPSTQYATRQLELRVRDAKARLVELCELLRDDSTDQATYQGLLHTRWMVERWIASAEKEVSRPTTSTGGRSIPWDVDVPVSSPRKARRDANLAHFFAHSPTRTTTTSTRRRFSSPIDQPRRISRHSVEAPQLRKWPFTSTLRAPMELKGIPSPSLATDSNLSVRSLSPHSPSSPEHRHFHEVDLDLPVSEPSSPLQLQDKSSTSPTFPPVPDTPLDDPQGRARSGFAVIYLPPQPSDEELLAALCSDMETEPMPEYVSYLLGQLDPIGEGVILPGLSRRGTTTSFGFEFISRPSIEVYEYPALPRSRLLVRRSIRVPPLARTRLGICSGVREDSSLPASPRSLVAQGQASPRSGVFSKVRWGMTTRGHQ